MEKERILVVTERFYPEEFLINDLVSDFIDQGFDVEVLTQIPSYPFDEIYNGYKNSLYSVDNYKGIAVHRVKTRLGYNKSILRKILGYMQFSFLTWLTAFRIGYNFDIIYYYHTGPATMAHSSFVFKRFFKKRCFIWTQDIWPDVVFSYGIKETKFRRKILNLYLKHLYSNFDKVSVSCKGFIPIIKEYYKREVIHIPQWYPGKEIKLTENIVLENLEFTFLGNIGSVQNLENVCLGFIKAIKSGLKANLHIVGDGVFLDRLKEIKENYSCNNIKFYGRRPFEEMETFIHKSNVMIISLKNDPLFNLYVPAKFQQYLAGGRPIFSILNGDVSEIVNKNELGLTTNPSDIENICNNFILFESLDLNSIGRKSYDYYKKNYFRDNCIKKICQLIGVIT